MRLRIAYGRVSTSKGEQLSALKTQVAWLQQQACDLVLTDVESGLNPGRSEYQRMRKLITEGRVSEVVATSFSRLGRMASECDAFVQLCDANDTAVTTRDDGRLTMATPEDLTLTRLKASLAQGESMRISQRVKGARRQGITERRPMRRAPFGYRLSRDRRRLEVDPEQAPIARQLLADLKAAGWRMQPVLERYLDRIPLRDPGSLRYWLANPVLRGGLSFAVEGSPKARQMFWETHEALLSHEDFAEMEAVRAVNRRLWGRHADRAVRALTGLCICQECGLRMAYKLDHGWHYLRCNKIHCSSRAKTIREDRLLAWVVKEMSDRAAERLAQAVDQTEHPEIAALRRQIEALESQCDPDLEDALERKRARLKSMASKPAIDQDLIQKIADPAWFSTLSYDELTTVLHQTVACILIAKQAPAGMSLKP